jgi:RNA polymerase sigma-70 factor, ECF subfamily
MELLTGQSLRHRRQQIRTMNPSTTEQQLSRARSGDRNALSQVLAEYVPRLERMISLRMDARQRRHFEPSDVVQDALLEATTRFDEWCALASFPFYVWLRILTSQRLAKTERRFHQQKREVGRERELAPPISRISATGAAEWIVSTHTSPTQAARRAEMRELVTTALEQLDDLDREVLTLRHFEELSNEETALELGIEPAAASKRFTRALQRIRPALSAFEIDERRGS